jgi:histidinol-phosphate aminotransferase
MITARKHLKNVESYSVPPYTRKDKIRLDLNENLFGCSPEVIKALKKIIKSDLDIYPGYDLLTEKIANDYSVKKQNVLLTNGADDAIRIVIDTFVDRNEEVIIPVPTYSMFELYAGLSGARIIKVLYNQDYSFPIDKVLKNINHKTKLIVIVNPASPLGTLISEEDLIKILKRAKNSIILLDETYWHFAGVSSSKLINKFKNLIIVQTFSKVFALAGLRLGFLLANENYLPEINKIAFPYAATHPAVIAGYAAMKDTKYTKKVLQQINTEKKYLVEELRTTANKVFSTLTNFIIVDFGTRSNTIYKSLFNQGILVKDIGSMPMMKGFLRIAIGTHKENKILIEVLKSATNSH